MQVDQVFPLVNEFLKIFLTQNTHTHRYKLTNQKLFIYNVTNQKFKCLLEEMIAVSV